MPRARLKPLTEEEKFMLQLQQEQDLGRLQREYVFLERDRHLFTGGHRLAQLNEILGIFRKEQANILTDMGVATSSTRKKEDNKVAERLSNLLNEHDYYVNKVKEERQYAKEIDDQIKVMEKEVTKLRAQLMNDRQYEERIWKAMKTVEGLENKMEVQMRKFGSVCSELAQLRIEIKDLLSTRESFLKKWNKMIDKLVMGKRFLMDLIEQATIAYDQREEWCTKLQALRIKAHQDYLVHIQQMTELERKQDNNMKLEEFFAVKGQKRWMRDLEIKEAENREQKKERLKEKKERFEDLLVDIFEFTREPEVTLIASKFYNQEAANFSRFKYVNDLTEEMEVISDKLADYYVEIEEKRILHDQREESQAGALKSLEERLGVAKKEYDDSKAQLEETDAYLQKMLQGIQKLFQICHCVKDPIMELLGDNTTINTYNASLYMKILEKKIFVAMMAVYHKNKILFEKKKIPQTARVITEDRGKPMIYLLDRTVLSNPCPLCMETEMVTAVIDRLQKVVSRQSAKRRVAARLSLNEDPTTMVHNVSACHLPKSREIMQKRYQ